MKEPPLSLVFGLYYMLNVESDWCVVYIANWPCAVIFCAFTCMLKD